MDTNKMRVVTLKDLWNIFTERIVIIVLAAVIGFFGCVAFSEFMVKPQYASTATLYILRQSEDTSSGDVSNDFSLALKVVNDCTYMLRSHAVVDEVLEALALDMTYPELRGRISTSNPENTRVLEVIVEADTPEQAKQIVDMVCQIGIEKINSAMGYEQVNLYEEGVLNLQRNNSAGKTGCVLVGMAAAVLTYAVFLTIFLLDDRIRTDEDIANYLGLSILGTIPDANASGKEKHGHYAYAAKEPKMKRGARK